MFGTLSEVAEVMVPASKAWALYGTLEIAKLVSGGKIFENVEVIEGDGGTGTILKVTLKQQDAGGSNLTSFKEKFIMVDNENMVKVAEIVEGGFLDVGFISYRVKIEIKENPKDDDTGSSCLVKTTIEYEIKDEFAANASLVDTQRITNIVTLANQHLLKSN